jgi:hypothetical protein
LEYEENKLRERNSKGFKGLTMNMKGKIIRKKKKTGKRFEGERGGRHRMQWWRVQVRECR